MNMERHWCVVPAAGTGQRFGGVVPKQYLEVGGRSILRHTLDALLGHPLIAGVVVVLAAGDPHWPGANDAQGKPILTAIGGDSRAASVLSELCSASSAEAKKTTTDRSIQPSTATATHLKTRPQEKGVRGRRGSEPRRSRRRSSKPAGRSRFMRFSGPLRER